jgi:hypothetical protein
MFKNFGFSIALVFAASSMLTARVQQMIAESPSRSDGRARAWLESPGLGLAFVGLGFEISQAKPEA